MNKIKVSIDFDSTLSRKDVQRFAKEIIGESIEVWIVTSRISNEEAKVGYEDNFTIDRIHKANEELFRVADNVGIKREHIIFCNFTMKIDSIEGKGFLFHLDDDSDELMCIIGRDTCKPINVEHQDWESDCRKLIEIERYLENPNKGY